jgi:hypothetical protein
MTEFMWLFFILYPNPILQLGRVRVQLPHSGLTTFPELGTWK